MAEKSKYQDIDAVDAALDKGVAASESVTELEQQVGDTTIVNPTSYTTISDYETIDGYVRLKDGRYISTTTIHRTSNIALKKGEVIRARTQVAADYVCPISLVTPTDKNYATTLISAEEINVAMTTYEYLATSDCYVTVCFYALEYIKVLSSFNTERTRALEDYNDKNILYLDITSDNTTVGGYIKSDGSIGALASASYTDYIEVTQGQHIKIKKPFLTGAGVCVMCSNDYNVLRYLDSTALNTDGDLELVVDHAECYMRFGVYTADLPTKILYNATSNDFAFGQSLKLSDEIFPYPSISMFERVGFCGDSYVKGQLWVNGVVVGDKPNLCWGSNIARRNGIAGVIYAKSGATTTSWQTDADGLPKVLADTPCALYIFCFGINDSSSVTIGTLSDITDYSSYTEYPNTFYGNYGKIIEQIQNYSPSSKIIIMPAYTCRNKGNDYYAYCATAVKEITEHYGIAMIDTMDSNLMTTSFFKDGIVGGHPTAILHSAMAKDIELLIGKCLQRYYSYFKDYVGL